MIEARKSKTVVKLFAGMIRRMLAKHFYAHHLRGKDRLLAIDPKIPVIFYANHSAWWDGFLAFHLCHDVFKRDGVLMMDVKQLRKYRFFRWIGAFSVNQEDGKAAMQSIEYAVKQLQVEHRILWVYPQGILLPNDRRPMVFYHGISHIVKRLGCVQLIPIVHRYEFMGEQRPDVFSSIGPVQKIEVTGGFDPGTLTAELERRLTLELDSLRDDVAMCQFDGFEITLKGKSSTNIRYDSFRKLLRRS